MMVPSHEVFIEKNLERAVWSERAEAIARARSSSTKRRREQPAYRDFAAVFF